MRIKNIKKYYCDKEDYIRFKKWLIDNDLNIKTFAEKIEISDVNIHRYIKGEISITPKVEKLFIKGGFHIFEVNEREDYE